MFGSQGLGLSLMEGDQDVALANPHTSRSSASYTHAIKIQANWTGTDLCINGFAFFCSTRSKQIEFPHSAPRLILVPESQGHCHATAQALSLSLPLLVCRLIS